MIRALGSEAEAARGSQQKQEMIEWQEAHRKNEAAKDPPGLKASWKIRRCKRRSRPRLSRRTVCRISEGPVG